MGNDWKRIEWGYLKISNARRLIFSRRRRSFGESEFFWIIKNQSTNQKYLLVNTYSHHGVEAEVEYYREEGFDNLEVIPRRIETLELASDTDDEISKYLFGMYSIFEIKS